MTNIEYLLNLPEENFAGLLIKEEPCVIMDFEKLDENGNPGFKGFGISTYKTSDGATFNTLEGAINHELKWLKSEHQPPDMSYFIEEE